MLRAYVFIDQMNFEIAVTERCVAAKRPLLKLDYGKLPMEIVHRIPNATLSKTLFFIPRPDEFLMQDQKMADTYRWAIGLKSMPFFDVIDGEHVSRPTEGRQKDIHDKSSYYKVEKGTDINMAVHALAKAFYNAYDMAVFVSGDSDYISIYSVLKTIGKLTRIIPHVDSHLFLDLDFLESCERSPAAAQYANGGMKS